MGAQGRTIVICDRMGWTANRLQWRAGQLSGRTHIVTSRPEGGALASMEGRAIVRPNPTGTRLGLFSTSRFNGGPGNCPAEPPNANSFGPSSRRLQWRAGQLSGRTGSPVPTSTRSSGFNGGPGNCPAEPRRVAVGDHRRTRFNGGPGNCPAEPLGPGCYVWVMPWLQWRAGQLSGRTPDTHLSVPRVNVLQWRAGQLSGRTRNEPGQTDTLLAASMEGRAIVRPNTSVS